MNKYKNLFINLSNHIKEKFNTNTVLKYDIEDSYYWAISTITINRSNPWKHRFYALVHELGHIIIDSDENEKYYAYPSQNDTSRYSRKDAVAIISEELDAWKYGRIYIQNMFNVEIDKEYFDKLKTNCIMSYVVDSLEKVYGKQIDLSCVKVSV